MQHGFIMLMPIDMMALNVMALCAIFKNIQQNDIKSVSSVAIEPVILSAIFVNGMVPALVGACSNGYQITWIMV